MTTENTTEKLLDDEPVKGSEIPATTENKDSVYNRKCGAFWAKTGKDGKNYLSGEITIGKETHQVFIFKNNKKKKTTFPDYEMFFKVAPGAKEFI